MKFTKTLLPALLVMAVSLASVSNAVASPFEHIVQARGVPRVVVSGSDLTAFAACPAGTQLIGGGAIWVPNGPNIAITRSIPLVKANGWTVTGVNWSGTTRELYATVSCGIPKPGGGFASTFTQTSSGSLVGNGGQDLQEAGCPAGTQLLSGGGYFEDFSRARLGFVENDARGGWTVIGRNWSGTTSKVFAVSLCGVPGPSGGFTEIYSGFGGILGIPEPILAGHAGSSLGQCGPGAEVITVGGFWEADGSQLGRGEGLALTSFWAQPASSPSFDADGANMSNKTFEMHAKAQCGV